MRRSFKSLPPASSLDSLVQDRTNTRTSMKLFIVSAALACFALVTACNSDALRSGSASLAVQAQTMKDEYKLSADSKKDKSKSLPLTFSHLNHATKKDRKSTRLNSSHANISYAVFCLKKKKEIVRAHTSIPVTPIFLIPPSH